MNVVRGELLKDASRSLKFIMNESGIVFFPVAEQHRDVKTRGLSYEDDYRGNALAGHILRDHVEIRFHSAFSDERVRSIWRRVLQTPEVGQFDLGQLYYQGRMIS